MMKYGVIKWLGLEGRHCELYKIEYKLNDKLFYCVWFVLRNMLDKWVTFGLTKELRVQLPEIRWLESI